MSVQRAVRPGVVRATVFGIQPLWRSTLRTMVDGAWVGAVSVCKSIEDLKQTLDDAVGAHLLVADPDGVAEFADELRPLSRSLPKLTSIAVTERTDAAWAKLLFDAGVVEVVTKNAEVEEIRDALYDAIDRRLDWARLTAREVEILQLVAMGGSNRQVAAALWLSDQTIKFHLANVYRKLGVTSRREAVERACAVGLLSPRAALVPVEDPAGHDEAATALQV